MTLVDAGPIIALINCNDPRHADCVGALSILPSEPLLSTWPCFTEAMHLLFRAGGHPAQRELWRLVTGGRLVLHDLTDQQIARSAALMEQYQDRPMDLADATLMATAEALHLGEVFAFDQDFHIYRLADGSVLHVIP